MHIIYTGALRGDRIAAVFTACGRQNETIDKAHDIYYEIERRAPWPAEGHTSTTYQFRDIVVNEPLIIGIFAGHTHEEKVDFFADKIQYVAGANYNGSDVILRFQPLR